MRYLLVLLVLAGCARPTGEQRAVADLTRFGPYCEKLGFKSGTEQHAGCVHREAASQRNAAAIRSSGN
jgi:hypothetical protein